MVRARNGWVRAVRAVETNLDLDPKADAKARVALLGPLELAAKKASRRGGKAPSDGDATPVEEAQTT